MPTGCHCRIFVDVVVFLLSILDSGLSFMSISLWISSYGIFIYKRFDRKSGNCEKNSSEICPISGDWNKKKSSNLTWMCLMSSYLLLQSWKVTAFTVFEIFDKKKWEEGGVGGENSPPPPPLKWGLRSIL